MTPYEFEKTLNNIMNNKCIEFFKKPYLLIEFAVKEFNKLYDEEWVPLVTRNKHDEWS